MEQQGQETCVDYVVELFRPEDAQGVVQLFKAVYGDSYPIRIFYDPEKFIEANRTGEYHCVVARTKDGRVVGAHNLFRSAPYEMIYEWGVGLVLKEHRGVGVTRRIGKYFVDVAIPKLGIEEMFGEPVCNHLHMQKMCVETGYTETALEVALMPESAYAVEKSSSGRVATLMAFRCHVPKPHTVFVPAVYEDELRLLYERLDDERSFVRADEELPPTVSSQSNMQIFDFAQVARIAVQKAGADLQSHFSNLESEARDKGVVVIHAWLRLDSPAVGHAVETLRGRGYFIGGILPRWFDVDGVLMQKLFCNPDFEAIQLYSDRARKILEIVKSDWKRSRE